MKFARKPCGMDFGLPENFVRHPISDAWKAALQQQHRLDRGPAMTRQELFHPRARELPGEDLGRPVAPPGWLRFSAVKQDPPELTGVAEDQAVTALLQHQVIVFQRNHVRRLDAQLTRHAQMNAQPAAVGEAKEHLLAVRLGSQQHRATQRFPQGRDIGSTEDF